MDAQTGAKFFKAGGTLDPGTPSYVKRPADDDLFQQVVAGMFCYVLTARQMGKSSLMIRTAEQLGKEGIRTATIDLSAIGVQVTPEQWYLGVIKALASNLRLTVDPQQWWRTRGAFGPVQRFTDFLHDVVLSEIAGRVVIFVDEIDSTRDLDFADDFFAAIRVMYNLRATSPEYQRLTFVLLGVATPTDLIRDRNRTPFNIGQAIDLQDFSLKDAQPLKEGLEQIYAGRSQSLLDRIFYWTHGHPYLTQRLCLEIAAAPGQNWGTAQIDGLVQRVFLDEDSHDESNLQTVRDSIESNPENRQLLDLYRRIYEGRAAIAENRRDPLQQRLMLIGLVISEKGVLSVRNEIYRRVFNIAWIAENTPSSSLRKLIGRFFRGSR